MKVDDFEAVPVFSSGKRCAMAHAPWMGDWFVSWSPRNGNNNAEGPWAHWVDLAAWILSHPATEVVAPELFNPELRGHLHDYYAGGPSLSEEQIETFFGREEWV